MAKTYRITIEYTTMVPEEYGPDWWDWPDLLDLDIAHGEFVVLAAYFAITLAYSLVLKRKMMIDVVTLAVLYAIRIIGGGVAIAVPISEWLLAFSLFIFTSLALIKRHSELGLRLQAGLGDPTNRNYRLDDLPVIAALAAASGYCAVIIFALYLSSDTVRSLYRHPEMLWLACPLLVYWISRVLLLSHRRLLIDDPVVFAMKDKVSIAVGALMASAASTAWRARNPLATRLSARCRETSAFSNSAL